MTTPTLIQPADVVIQPLDRANTRYNARTRAPVKVLKRSSNVTIEAQIQFNSVQEADAQGGGLVKTTSGYLVARNTDLEDLGYTPGLGDKIVTIGSTTGFDLYITETSDTAWYDGAPTLKVIEFEDRRPSRGGV